ncbi:M2 family metallopeptidase [Sphingomonas canadensis]|uniref:M2 family metallopeptidase n=1 Tax=Sphingomonas canadensis TaxID=1219257 RepID=A0ABW3H8I9_9SPHN|nr:M2 family metallopeptidase [Sphingomonas canadensis]MCW3837523.1 M2 family metallopeptidase [Sphingomonas canadensis]
MIRIGTSMLALAAMLALPSVSVPAAAQTGKAKAKPAAAAAAQEPTAAEADAFVARAEKEFYEFNLEAGRVAWINATFITDDTDALVAAYGARGTEMAVKFALEAAKYQNVKDLSPDTKRKLDILRSAIVLPAPTRPGAAGELSEIATRIGSMYGKGRGTLRGKEISGSDIEAEMGTNRNPAELKEMWISWHNNVGAPMRADYAKMVGIANEGAGELGFKDVGAMWRSGYDMPADEFAALTDKLWLEVKPLYDSLHRYVRMKLNQKYGSAVQPASGPIRADLLGNMWAQEWGNIYDIVAPPGSGDLGFDVGELLQQKGYDHLKMVKAGENFYSSLGFAGLPDTFWTRSQFLKPRDREVQCHASAWDLDDKDDLRIKMCIKVNSDDFVTIHHELGHNYYQRAYKDQPLLYRTGANDGFHEAIGDFIALSITPEYLVQIGLLDPSKVPSADKDIGLLLRQAMDKVAFLPFGLLMDKWRWGVFSGETKTDNYNSAWNALRLRYQGITPPEPRGEDKFDPGAKYHIPNNVPYTRYFLARILQFQFYKAACEQAGWKGPLHRCSFFGNKEVGTKLNAMLAMGASKPWPDALEAFTGTREISGKALVEYFGPLKDWLDEQTKGQPEGW